MNPSNDWMKEANTQIEMDAALEKTRVVQDWVRASQSDEVSLKWRSQLNERLLTVATPAKKAPKRWFMPAFAGALACSVIIAGFWVGPIVNGRNAAQNVASTSSLEERLISAHIGMEFAATSSTTGASRPLGSESDVPLVQWGPEDLDSL